MNFESLKPRVRGEILTQESGGYETARRIWNGMIDRRPAAIARCTQPEDVLEVVRFAADHDIYPAVRAGGHNVAGTAMVEGGLVIDVSQMKQIAIDVQSQTARAQTGLTWG
ncbi:MAG: FAD-dependent oxidoreductase, partial [Bryobacteraceae bacterium]